jgi:methyl-accepting chemotaxis protein
LATGSRTTIRRRLAVAVVGTTLTALAVASVGFVSLELSRFRSDLVRGVALLGDVVALNSAVGLLFHDPRPVEDALGSLAAEPTVLGAAVYELDGTVFADYQREDTVQAAWPGVDAPHDRFEGNVLHVYRDIVSDGERIGTIYLRADSSAWIDRAGHYVAIVLLALGGAAAVAAWASRGLQQRVAAPLASLAEGAGALAEGDLSTVVEIDSDDEIGDLGAAFNRMAAGLRELVARIREDTGAVSGAAAVVSDSSQGLLEEVRRQAEAADEGHASVARMGDSVAQVAANVDGLATTATDTSSSVVEMDTSISEIAGNIGMLAQTIDEATSAVSQMTVSIGEVSRNAATLDEATEGTARSLKAMMTSVSRVEENARRCQQSSERAREEASVGVTTVDGVVDGMDEIRSSFGDLESAVSSLNQRSQSIGEVVQVIEGVVSQTNLLALNASIIAAQAGEHGRAFAVVAQEVQGLAETTASSTREIEGIIKAVQRDISAAVEAVDRGSKRVERGSDLSRSAGEILRGLDESARASAELVGEIVEAATRQEDEIRELDVAMIEVKNLVAQIAHATREQNNASSEITRGVDRVRSLGDEVRRATGEQSRQSRLITAAVEEVAERIGEIARSGTQLREESERIQQALDVIRDLTAGGARRSEDLRQVVETLSSRSSALDAEVGRFVLDRVGASGAGGAESIGDEGVESGEARVG